MEGERDTGEGCRKRKASGEIDGDVDRRRNLREITAAISDGEEGEGEEAELTEIEEEAVAELMRWLEREISFPSVCYRAPDVIAINGNEESCGPSFSDAAATVMASIDAGGGDSVSYFIEGSATSATEEEIPPSESLMAGGGVEEEEEWLTRVISGVDFELDLL